VNGVGMVGSYEVIRYVDLSQSYVSFQYYIFNMLLITLLVIHLYWWVLIMRMLIKQLRNRGKVGDDVRSGPFFSHSHHSVLQTILAIYIACALLGLYRIAGIFSL
jgi:hypothetical protein